MTKKYKIHELAKDFDIQSKYVIENLSKHFEGEKKSQTALEEKELDFLFDLITKENSVESFDAYFNAVPKEKPKAEKKETPAPKADKAPQKSAKKENAPAAVPSKPVEQPKKKEKDPSKPMQARTKGEKRTIDTRANSFDAETLKNTTKNMKTLLLLTLTTVTI